MMREQQSWSQDSLVESREHYDEKLEKKLRLVRNEFQTVGKFEMPLIRRQNIDVNKIQPWCFTKAKPNDFENKHKTIHFFTYDWLFDSVYDKPEKSLEKLDQYYALLTPEFSTYKDMPLTVQAHSTFKNRWCGAFWQSQGLRVIPTIAWGTPSSWEFCFDGVEQGAVVVVSTYALEDNEKGFIAGYNEMLRRINPSMIICYGEPFDSMRGNVKAFSPYDFAKLEKQMGREELLKKYLAGELYPSN